jgi:uncharacterized protein (TIGR02058 family)
MTSKRFTVELGCGVDLHGENMTEAACRAVKDAVSRSCLCGLVEILGLTDPNQILVDIVIACPRPEDVDLELVKSVAPIGRTTARAIDGGMQVLGLCVPSFGPNCDQIVVANAALTVHILDEKE